MYMLQVNLKEANHGGYNYTEPEKTVLELVSNDKMKFVGVVLDLFKKYLLGSSSLFQHQPSVNGKYVKGDNREELLLRLIKEELEDSLLDYKSGELDEHEIIWWNASNWSESTATISIRKVQVV